MHDISRDGLAALSEAIHLEAGYLFVAEMIGADGDIPTRAGHLVGLYGAYFGWSGKRIQDSVDAFERRRGC